MIDKSQKSKTRVKSVNVSRKKKTSNPSKKVGGRVQPRTTPQSYMASNPESIRAYEKLYSDMMKDKRNKRLQSYKWGFGLEHETHLFHWNYEKYLDNPKSNIKAFELFDSETAVNNILKAEMKGMIKLDHDEKIFIQSKVPFEKTGRKCNGVDVLKKAPYLMPEFITTEPFSSLKTGKKPVEAYSEELIKLKKNFLKILLKDSRVVKQTDKKGQLNSFPFGMSNYVLFDGKPNPEYTGSYHITMTLPYNSKTTTKQFRDMHVNFANQMQWLEPLLLTAFFSCDDKAVGTLERRARGSFRVLRIAWGNFAGSYVKNFKKGIGRYANINTHWRDGFDFHEKKKLEPCIKPSPYAIREGGITTLSSDFRTFGPDPSDPSERISGASMDKPNGMEFRIFDEFNDEDLIRLIRLMVYVAENSKHHKTKKFVNKNKEWIKALQDIMMNGWRTILEPNYIDELRVALNLKIKTQSRMAYNVFKVINKELFDKNKKGDIPYLLFKTEYKQVSLLPDVNRRSWDNGFMLKLNNSKSLMGKYNLFLMKLKTLNKTHMKRDDVLDLFCKYFDRKNWEHNLDDVLYFMEYWYNIVKVNTSTIGNVISIDISCNKIEKISNFNNYILHQVMKTHNDSIEDLHKVLHLRKFLLELPRDKFIKIETYIKIWDKYMKEYKVDPIEFLNNIKNNYNYELRYLNKTITHIKFGANEYNLN